MPSREEAVEGLRSWLEWNAAKAARGVWLDYSARLLFSEDGSSLRVENESLKDPRR